MLIVKFFFYDITKSLYFAICTTITAVTISVAKCTGSIVYFSTRLLKFALLFPTSNFMPLQLYYVSELCNKYAFFVCEKMLYWHENCCHDNFPSFNSNY